jgi:hypothetical protein
MNPDLLDVVAAFVNDRGLRERLGYNVDTCIKRRIVPLPLPLAPFRRLARVFALRLMRTRRDGYLRVSFYHPGSQLVISFSRMWDPEMDSFCIIFHVVTHVRDINCQDFVPCEKSMYRSNLYLPDLVNVYSKRWKNQFLLGVDYIIQ